MLCSSCSSTGKEVEMETRDGVENFHNPAEAHGHGQITGKVAVCPECGHAEEVEPNDPEPLEI
jgi:predicted RNA-binding Zn-ribbon protein involved in translation (DUF1610 family)